MERLEGWRLSWGTITRSAAGVPASVGAEDPLQLRQPLEPLQPRHGIALVGLETG